eukprot:4771414-Pyramimonas_sp.AAC.1
MAVGSSRRTRRLARRSRRPSRSASTEGGFGDHRQDREDQAGELEPGKRLGQGAVALVSPLEDAAMGDPGPSAAGAAPGG